jgi:hypothetical protein
MIAPLAQEIDRFLVAYKMQALKSDCENRAKTLVITLMKQNEHGNHVPVLYIQSSMKEYWSFGVSSTNVLMMRHEQIPLIFCPWCIVRKSKKSGHRHVLRRLLHKFGDEDCVGRI